MRLKTLVTLIDEDIPAENGEEVLAAYTDVMPPPVGAIIRMKRTKTYRVVQLGYEYRHGPDHSELDHEYVTWITVFVKRIV